MLERARIFLLVWIFFSAVNPSLAQGTLRATLLPFTPSVPPLSATVTVYTPNTNGVGLFFPVYFEIIVNTNAPIFTVGRIAGGSTAWAFDLDAPTNINGSSVYSGTTEMGAFQIEDMLANRTDFEINSYQPGYINLYGSLFTVPEPQSACLLGAGLVITSLRWRSRLTT